MALIHDDVVVVVVVVVVVAAAAAAVRVLRLLRLVIGNTDLSCKVSIHTREARPFG